MGKYLIVVNTTIYSFITNWVATILHLKTNDELPSEADKSAVTVIILLMLY